MILKTWRTGGSGRGKDIDDYLQIKVTLWIRKIPGLLFVLLVNFYSHDKIRTESYL